MHHLDTAQVVYSLSPHHPPVLTIEPGETVRVSTLDCFGGQIRCEQDQLSRIDWERINPATGPIAVRGARPGDTLAVDILDIRVAPQGVMVAVPGDAGLGRLIPATRTKVIPLTAGKARFSPELTLPAEPMIGVIGTAPAELAVPTGTPGPHGGNMDCREIRAGTTLYLPVFVPGALLALGDLHAAMGDGEVVGVGIETAGEVDLRVRLLPGIAVPLPVLENPAAVMTIASAATLEEAAQTATAAMVRLLVDSGKIDASEAAMLLSVTGQLRICQIVDPLLTVRMELPRSVLTAYGISLFPA